MSPYQSHEVLALVRQLERATWRLRHLCEQGAPDWMIELERRGVLRRIEAFPKPAEEVAHEADQNSPLADETNDFASQRDAAAPRRR